MRLCHGPGFLYNSISQSEKTGLAFLRDVDVLRQLYGTSIREQPQTRPPPRRYAIKSKISSDHGAGRSAHSVGFGFTPLLLFGDSTNFLLAPVPKGVLTIEKFSIN